MGREGAPQQVEIVRKPVQPDQRRGVDAVSGVGTERGAFGAPADGAAHVAHRHHSVSARNREGTRPALAPFVEKTGHTGAMISAVDLLKGIAVGADMKVVEVEGANGGLDTNYEGKADAAVEALLKDDLDFAYIHLEAPDEMGHQGSFERKVQAIENLDKRIIKRVTEQLEAAGTDFRMLVLPDHPTPVAIRTHVSDPVPYMLYDSTNKQSHTWNYNEKEAQESGNYIDKGYTIINHLFEK